MGLLDKAKASVYKPIAKATADYLREAAKADINKATSPYQVGPAIKRTALDTNMQDSSLRRKPGSSVGFDTLRRFSRTHEISRICINARKRQITSLEWDIVPVNPEDKTDYTQDIDLLKAYFKNLGGYRMRFRELQDTLIEDLLVLDAGVLYKQRSRGGDIQYYMPVDGSTIKLRVDSMGNTPQPPEIAYRQVIRGSITGEFTADEMIYEMMNPRTDTPYGLAPLESLILIVTSSLKGTLYNLDYLTAGNVPEGFLKMPETWSTTQITEFMTYFDALMSGNSEETTKVKAIAGDYTPTKKRDDMAFKDFNDWLLKVTCAMFDIQPQEIGFTMDVNKATGSEQNSITMRRGILPLANLLAEIWNDIIQEDLGFPQLQFKYTGLEDRDALADANTKQVLLGAGIQTIDEVRKEMGLDPIGQDQPYVLGSPTFVADTVPETEQDDNVTYEDVHDEPVKTISADDELRKFKTYAIKRIKDGKQLRKFSSAVLEPVIVDRLNKALDGCSDVDYARKTIDGIRGNPDFLAKAADESGDFEPNPYFDALIATDAFKRFEADFRDGIESQASWTAKALLEMEDRLLGVDLELSADQVAKLNAYLYDNMPSIADKVDKSLVEAWYVKVVNDSVSGIYADYKIDVDFSLRSESYINMLNNKATQLLSKSTLDTTTRKQLSKLIVADRKAGMTYAEIAKHITDEFANISSVRARMIAYTETANLMNDAQFSVMKGAGVKTKEWLLFGPNPCAICIANAGDGSVKIDSFFSSGDLMPAAHVNCECGLDYDVLSTVASDFWDGS